MAKEEMGTDVGDVIRDLAVQELDAFTALDAGLEHLKVDRDRVQVENFLETHRSHLAELDALLFERNETPPVRGDVREFFRKAKVAIARLAGEKGILVALKTNVDALATSYHAALADDRLTDRERQAIDRMYAEQQWHSAWLEGRLNLHPDVGEAIMADEGENERARNSVSER